MNSKNKQIVILNFILSLLQLNRVREQNVLGNSARHNALRLKLKSLFVNGLLDSAYRESDESGKHDPL